MSPIIKYLHKLVGYIGHLDRIINGKCIRTVQTDVYLPEKKKCCKRLFNYNKNIETKTQHHYNNYLTYMSVYSSIYVFHRSPLALHIILYIKQS